MICKKCGRSSDDYLHLKFYARESGPCDVKPEILCEDCFKGVPPTFRDDDPARLNVLTENAKLQEEILREKLHDRLELCKYGTGALRDDDAKVILRELCDIVQELLTTL